MTLTPERKEVYKERTSQKHPNCSVHITAGELKELLTALEEAEQQIKEWQDEASQWRDDLVEKTSELGEAQQTIARQREALEFYAKKENYETKVDGDRWEPWEEISDDKGNRAKAALEGNKRGEKTK